MIVIVDIDNTLSINKQRYQLATMADGKINWDILYDHKHIIADKPNLPMIHIVNMLYDKFEIILLTSRPDLTLASTKHWLNIHNVSYHKLYMRSPSDHYMKAVELKKNMYNNFINDKVFCAFDDNEDIISMWSSLNIPCFKIYV